MISIEKITINIGAGEAGDKLEKAKKLVEKMSGQKAVETIATKRIPTWGVRKGLPLGIKTTMRGVKARDLLKRFLAANDNKMKASSFDSRGNVSFGIKEYIEVPGMKYDPEVGMFGFDVSITMKKWGYRINKRKIRTAKYPQRHLIKKEETMEFMKKNFNVEVLE